MANELEMTRKEVVVAQSWNYPSICLEGLRKSTKTSVRVADLLAEIRTEYLPSTSQERYRPPTRSENTGH
jgi:hypothetical protein